MLIHANNVRISKGKIEGLVLHCARHRFAHEVRFAGSLEQNGPELNFQLQEYDSVRFPFSVARWDYKMILNGPNGC